MVLFHQLRLFNHLGRWVSYTKKEGLHKDVMKPGAYLFETNY